MKKIIGEPLVQFIFIGIFLSLMMHHMPEDNSLNTSAHKISINDDTLMQYIQTQAKQFSPGDASRYLDNLPNVEKEKLVQDYVREEALYREALALGLEQNDVVIRRRLVQKMKYISQGFYDDMAEPGERDLADYLRRNHEDYRVEAAVSFTHIFFSTKKHGDTALLKAVSELTRLNKQGVAFEEGGSYGDRFLYNRNYIERTQEFVVGHFGSDFMENLFRLVPGSNWQGPLESEYGYHLIYLKEKTESRLPELDEVAPEVLADARRDQRLLTERNAVAALVDKYTILKAEDDQ